jgi:formylglycine-generating enzyme required for sulfatase activity
LKVRAGKLGIGSTMISDKDGMVMVYAPAGEFEMGSENGDDDESPTLPCIWMQSGSRFYSG